MRARRGKRACNPHQHWLVHGARSNGAACCAAVGRNAHAIHRPMHREPQDNHYI
jgi:hypothetical protein